MVACCCCDHAFLLVHANEKWASNDVNKGRLGLIVITSRMRIVIDSKVPELRVPLDVMPYFFGDGEKCCVLPAKWVTRRDERFMGIHLITRRQQFGFCYNQLAGSYFHSMPNPSGVLVRPFVKTDQVVPGVRFPGDIDLLILPYEEE